MSQTKQPDQPSDHDVDRELVRERAQEDDDMADICRAFLNFYDGAEDSE